MGWDGLGLDMVGWDQMPQDPHGMGWEWMGWEGKCGIEWDSIGSRDSV